jgi:GTPase SAR1 family protein
LTQVSPLQDAPRDCEMVLCANKTDLPEEMWEVSREQFNLFAEENKLAIFESSASSGTRVDEVCLTPISFTR